MAFNNDLIFGKNNLERVVSCEVKCEEFITYVQTEDGNVERVVYPNENWVLSTKPLAEDFERLDGDLHYKYGKIYTDNALFQSLKPKMYKYDTYFMGDNREQNLIIKGITYFKGLTPKEITLLSFDIETTGLKHDANSKLLLIANTLRKNGVLTRKMFCYDEYEDEGAMIEAWCAWVREVDPSMMIGHNVLNYDFNYIKYIADKFGVKLLLGRDGSELAFDTKKPGVYRVDGGRDMDFTKIRCFGREILDTMFMAMRYDAVTKKYESYGLKPIIKHEGLEAVDRVFYDAGEIRFKYHIPEEWAKIKAYAEFDGDDCIKLYDKMIAAYFYFNQSVPKTFQAVMLTATGSQLNSIMVRSYLQHGHSIPKADQNDPFQGAISFGNKGVHNNAFKVDVKSLYPSIMIQYQIYDKKKDPKAHFLKMVEHFTYERFKNKDLFEENKEQHYYDLEQAQKIGINSAYGLLGTGGLNFNKFYLASLVTEKGREILQKAILWSCGYELEYIPSVDEGDDVEEPHERWKIPDNITIGNYFLCNCDTDSIAIKKLDSSPFTKEERKTFIEQLNANYPKHIIFADDGFFPKFIVLKAKNYIMLNEKGEVKLKGSSLKSSTLEPVLKQMLKEIIDSLLADKNDFTTIYHKYVRMASNITDIRPWCSKKSISEKTLKGDGTTQVKMRAAIEGTDYVEGDRVYMYFKSDDSLGIAETFDGDYNKEKMYEKVFKTTGRFWDDTNILSKDLFPNYKLKKNKKALEEVLQ